MTLGPQCGQDYFKMRNSNDTTGNRTGNLMVCSVVPQTTMPPHAPEAYSLPLANSMHIHILTAMLSSDSPVTLHTLKARSITHSECTFVAFVMHNATHIRHIILSSVACPALRYFSALPNKGVIFKKVTEHKMCIMILSVTSETFLILGTIQRDELWSSCKVTAILFRF